MARLGPLFDPEIPRKSLRGSLLPSFPGNEAHNFFLGRQNGVWGGGQKVYVAKAYVLIPSPIHRIPNFLLPNRALLWIDPGLLLPEWI